MSNQNGSATIPTKGAEPAADSKGKGKSIAGTEDVSMDTGDDSSSEEELDEVRCTIDVFVYPTSANMPLGCPRW